MPEYLMFVGAFAVSMLSGRIQLLSMRAAIEEHTTIGNVVSILAGICFFAIIAWGFASLPWYFVVGAVAIVAIASNLMIGSRNFVRWYQFRVLIDEVTIIITALLWTLRWPF